MIHIRVKPKNKYFFLKKPSTQKYYNICKLVKSMGLPKTFYVIKTMLSVRCKYDIKWQ